MLIWSRTGDAFSHDTVRVLRLLKIITYIFIENVVMSKSKQHKPKMLGKAGFVYVRCVQTAALNHLFACKQCNTMHIKTFYA